MEEELDGSRNIIKMLKKKNHEMQTEINDLQNEQNDEKEDLMVQVRQQELDIKFYRRVCEMIMKPEELKKLQMKSSYDDSNNEWHIPVFVLKNKEVALPSLSIKKQAQEFMENQKDERVMKFEGEDEGDSSGNNGSANSRRNANSSNYMA